jgi:hypothetical protein
MFNSILVLESPWDSSSVVSKSVWPFVSEFAKVKNIQAYHQVFNDRSSFIHWVEQFNREDLNTPKLLYIASHGENGRISGLQKKINKETIISTLYKANNIKYVQFGSCFFGNKQNLTELLETAEHLKWAAGYEETIDWVDSTLFDLMFWGRIVSRDEETKGKKTHILASNLLDEVSGLAKNLGFRFQYRYGDNIKSLL